jgi:uncharacterized protein
MVKRKQWIHIIEGAWKEKSVIWLAGVRRSGKTFLAKSLEEIQYFDCELPRTRKVLEDPEDILKNLSGKKIVLDEIHRLENPSQFLKIAADHFPDVKILATGSSTLGASTKFKDTLTGRKKDIYLTPITFSDLVDFDNTDLNHRLFAGGLPPFFLSKKFPESDFQDWIDSYWAKDIQELFSLEKRASFQKFIELVLSQSGGIFEANKFARPCEVSRPTISNYLKVLEATFLVSVIRPFSTNFSNEITAAPKVYSFDTGFTSYFRGWDTLRFEDKGFLWEHFVLNEMQAHMQRKPLFYWRDKSGHEIDFVLKERGERVSIIECKWSSDSFDPKNLKIFRGKYPLGENYLIANDIDRGFTKNFNGLSVHFNSIAKIARILEIK